MKLADAALQNVERDARAAELAVKAVKGDSSAILKTIAEFKALQKAEAGVRDTGLEAGLALKTIDMSAGSVAKTKAELYAIAAANKKVRDTALEAALAEQMVQTRGTGGRFGPNAIPLGPGTNVAGYNRFGYGMGGGSHPAGLSDAAFRRLISFGPGGNYGLTSAMMHMSPKEAAADYLMRHGVSPTSESEAAMAGGILSGGGGRSRRRTIGDLYNGDYGRGRGRYDVPGLNALAGVLPGGRRARPLAVLTGLGAALAATPSAIPGAVGLGAAGSAGIVALLGGIGTLKLAFADLNKAAFTTQKGFNALNPVQKEFVQSLRSLDYGFVKPLEQLAASRVLPGLTAALHAALTPAAAGAIRGGVSAFGGAISGGAQQLGKLFGSQQFSAQFGTMLKQDAGLLREMFKWLTNLTDAFVHASVAAGPFVDWLAKGTTHFTMWVDDSIKAAQATGQFASYMDKAKSSLQTWGKLVGQFGQLFGAIFGGVGFKNSVGVVNLFTNALKTLTEFINSNKETIRAFMSALIKSVGDLNKVVRLLSHGITIIIGSLRSVLKPLQDATGGFIGLRSAIDAVLLALTLKWLDSIVAGSAAITGIGTAAAGASTLVWGLRAALLALAGIGAFKLGEKVGNWIAGGDPNGGYGTAASKAAAAAALAKYGPGVWVNAQGKPVDADGNVISNLKTAQANAKAAMNPALASSPMSASGKVYNGNPFAKPPPIQGTGKTGALPSALENQIAKTLAEGTPAQQISALQKGVAWIHSNVNSKWARADQTVQTTMYQEEASLKSQIDSLKNQIAGGKPSLLDSVFPRGRQGALTAAVTRYNTMTGAGSSHTQQLRAAAALISVAVTQQKYLTAEEHKYGAESKKGLEIKKQMKIVQADITRAQNEEVKVAKQITAEHVKAVKAAEAIAHKAFRLDLSKRATGLQTAVENFRSASGFGASPQETENAANRLKRFAETQRAYLVLLFKTTTAKADELAIQKRINADTAAIHKATEAHAKAAKAAAQNAFTARAARILGIGLGAGDVSAARESSHVRKFLDAVLKSHGLAAAGNRPLKSVAEQLFKAGDITKRQLVSLEKILAVITDAKDSNKKIESSISGNISQRLSQIKDELRSLTGFSNLNAVTTEQQILKHSGIHITGTKEQRAKFMEQANEALQNKGRLSHAVGSVLGVPLRPGGFPALVHHKIEVHVTADGNTHMSKQAAKNIAEEVYTIFQKQRRRNTTLMTGANAGRSLGAGLG